MTRGARKRRRRAIAPRQGAHDISVRMVMVVLAGEVRVRMRVMVVIARDVRVRAVRVLMGRVPGRPGRRRRRRDVCRLVGGVMPRRRPVAIGTTGARERDQAPDPRGRGARHGFFFGCAEAIFCLSAASSSSTVVGAGFLGVGFGFGRGPPGADPARRLSWSRVANQGETLAS